MVGEPLHALHWSDLERTYRTQDAWLTPRVRVPGVIARTLAALDTLDLDRARAERDELGAASEDEELWAFLVYTHCQVALSAGDAFAALSMLRRSITAHTQQYTPTSFARPLMQAAEIDLLLALGEGNKASALAREITAPANNPWTLTSVSRLHHRIGRHDVALALCHQFDWDGESYPRTQMESLLIEALAYSELDDHERAAQSWTHACAVADQTGLLRPFTTISSADIAALDALASTSSRALAAFLEAPAGEVFSTPVRMVTLTQREQEALYLLGRGMGVQDIAETLCISVNTVKTQLRTLYRKIDAHSRTQAIARAHELHLI